MSAEQRNNEVLGQLASQVQDLSKNVSRMREEYDGLYQRLKEEVLKNTAAQLRTAENDNLTGGVRSDADYTALGKSMSTDGKVDWNSIHNYKNEEGAALLKNFHSAADDLLIAQMLTRGLHNTVPITNVARQYEVAKSSLSKALSTSGAGVGAEWIPTVFSPEFQRAFYLALNVPNLFRRVNMPTKTFTLPVSGAAAVAYNKSEATSDTPTEIINSDLGTLNMSFSAKAFGALVRYSTELTEDSIVATIPIVRDTILTGLAHGLEECIISGHTGGSHMDSDIGSSTTDRRTLFNGIRYYCDALSNEVNLGTHSWDNLVGVRRQMGKWAVSPTGTAYIVSPLGYFNLLTLRDAQNNNILINNPNWGANDPSLTGAVGQIAGSPVIVSEFVREDLDATGVYSGTGNTKTLLLLVNRQGFMLGDRRLMTIENTKEIKYDQGHMVGTWRGDFVSVYGTTQNVCALGYNVATS